ncbi:hypothetical protein K435DRAFT_792650 [Dendrothele bispora CBS 962.96]|uniref:Restriction endonuclease type IV Mrr domain-containing protein n=1 Tax=Dendrothele bispora (strain CBS 962.96) TaxID=1314807 RepID=A0A4S8MHX2_DENBC|nr:hypothetical protein K435DRAFT_792650 [Dendrothele bispora CBS 962.96]
MDQSGIMNTIAKWGNDNGAKLEGAYRLKGGWEGWAQVELALVLKQMFETNNPGSTIEVTREDPVYSGGTQRSDILITTRKGAQHFTNMIELKCESIANAANFTRQVSEDCAKVNNGAIIATYRPCKAWVVAFSVTKNLGNLQVGGGNLGAYSKTIQAGGTLMTLWWGTKDFQ